MGARFSTPVQTKPGANLASYTRGTGYFPGEKRPGSGVDCPPHLVPRLKKDKSYTSTLPLGLRGLLHVELLPQKFPKQTVNFMRTSGTKCFEINTQKNKLLFYRKCVRTTKARRQRKCEIFIVVYDVGFSSFGDYGAYCLLRYGGLWSGRNLPTLPPPSSMCKTAVAVSVRSP